MFYFTASNQQIPVDAKRRFNVDTGILLIGLATCNWIQNILPAYFSYLLHLYEDAHINLVKSTICHAFYLKCLSIMIFRG